MSLSGSDHTGHSGWEGKGPARPAASRPLEGSRQDKGMVCCLKARLGAWGVGSEDSREPLLRRSSREKDVPPFPGEGSARVPGHSLACLFSHYRCAHALRPT